ncbi:serine hydrolase domain-containing protein [Tunicatimonas pelagia]|uniref:serine hydrolase domain-containing protein n=1 Tax=Tunicatimonas pelagia TaxID=931531 RepID=UPI002665FDEA|nr:serine hydrolase [Tunicatimonas pelagia]WKN41528.1 serine hydrolase [Tunicatimonas pelagia]
MRYPYLLTLCFILSIPTFVWAQSQPYFPTKTWENRSPQDVGLNAEQLQKAVDFAQNNEYEGDRDLKVAILKGFAREPYHEIKGPTKDRGGPAGIVLKNGYIAAQWGDVERVDMTFSVTKSYLSTMAGLAVDAGLIANVNDSVASYVWDGKFAGAHNSQITWDHLLTQSSDWSGTLFATKDWADRPPSEGGIDDWKYRELLTPGTNFEYNDVRVNLLAYSLLQVWRKPLPMVLKEKIMDPIGASTTWRWYGYDDSFVNVDGIMMQSVSGGGHSGGGVFISTLDHARFGLLFLRRGNWNGQQLISERWIEQAITSSTANASYGYMWWVNRGERAWEGVSPSVYYAAGFGGNFIVIDNEHDLVIVTRWLQPSQIGEMVRLVISSVE